MAWKKAYFEQQIGWNSLEVEIIQMGWNSLAAGIVIEYCQNRDTNPAPSI